MLVLWMALLCVGCFGFVLWLVVGVRGIGWCCVVDGLFVFSVRFGLACVDFVVVLVVVCWYLWGLGVCCWLVVFLWCGLWLGVLVWVLLGWWGGLVWGGMSFGCCVRFYVWGGVCVFFCWFGVASGDGEGLWVRCGLVLVVVGGWVVCWFCSLVARMVCCFGIVFSLTYVFNSINEL